MSSSKGDSLSSSSALKILIIFLSKRSKSLKRENFDIRQGKFKNNTDVYLQNFLRHYAKFSFLNHIGFCCIMPHPKVYITGHPENQRFLGKRRNSVMSEQQIEICCERCNADFDAREVKFVRSKKAYKYGKNRM